MEFNGTFFVTIISFIFFVFLMNKILYLPVRKIVDARNDLINGNYALADDNNKKAEDMSKKREIDLLKAKEDARLKYNEVLDDYKEQRVEIISAAQKDAGDELNEAYRNLENVSNEAKNELKTHIADLANDIVEKVLGYRSEVQNIDNEAVDGILYR
jgi:F-type H+-transporting ATPase subunit b